MEQSLDLQQILQVETVFARRHLEGVGDGVEWRVFHQTQQAPKYRRRGRRADSTEHQGIIYGTVHAQKTKGVLVLYFNIDRHVVSHNAIPGSAEYHLKSLNAPNMVPVFNVAFRSAFAHPADLVKYV